MNTDSLSHDAPSISDSDLPFFTRATPQIRMASQLNQSSSTLARQWGMLWGKGHENLGNGLRRILSVQGSGATTYLQGLVTSDLLKPPEPPNDYIQLWHKGLDQIETAEPIHAPEPPVVNDELPIQFNTNLRATCFLDHKGRILTDALLWKLDEGNQYLIDVPRNSADQLMQHLQHYQLRRSKVQLSDLTGEISSHVVYGTYNSQNAPPGFNVGMDPRHPSLGMRVVSMEHGPEVVKNMLSSVFPPCPGTYEVLRKLGGVAEGNELLGKTALEANQEWLQAVSFHKGCYLGQELTARTMHTGTIRKRILPVLLLDTTTQLPRPWISASQMQEERDGILAGLTNGSPLPALSMPSVGGLMSVLTGQVPEGAVKDEDSGDMKKLQEHAELHMRAMEEHVKPGEKMVDAGGNTIGQVVSTPAAGTFCVLAQLRLDKTGLVEGEKWSRTNKIKVGGKEFRYLPYMPLWWPRVDRTTGKQLIDDGFPAKLEENEHEEEVETL